MCVCDRELRIFFAPRLSAKLGEGGMGDTKSMCVTERVEERELIRGSVRSSFVVILNLFVAGSVP